MSWRAITEVDLGPCMDVQPAHLGGEIVGPEIARRVWARLVRDPFFTAIAFESDPPIQGHRVIGFGASAFVTGAFMDAELAHPCPNINSRIIASVHAGQSVLLNYTQIARANADVELDVVILSGSWRDTILSPSQTAEVQILLPTTFATLHAGYRIRRIAWETISEPETRFARSSGVYQAIASFSPKGSLLNLTTPSTSLTVAGSVGNVVFRNSQPLLRLSQSEQQLLIAAHTGGTDADLASKLGLRVPAVKARWRSVFARIAEIKPELVNDIDGRKGRGLQKRNRIVAYVRDHPEDLRPYAWNENPPKKRSRLAGQIGG